MKRQIEFGKRNLDEHIKNAHFIKVETLKYVCQICDKSYLQLKNFRKHEKEHKSLKKTSMIVPFVQNRLREMIT